MQKEVMFAGFGGQGILASAKILARAAMQAKQAVAWVPSYGPEMRGGTAYCTVVISDRLIGSPIIANPLHLVAMNQPSLEKFAPLVRPNGLILVNSTLISICSDRSDVDELRIPVNDLALSVGRVRTANIVALGALVSGTGLVDMRTLRACVESEFSKNPRMVPINLAALEAGRVAVAPNGGSGYFHSKRS